MVVIVAAAVVFTGLLSIFFCFFSCCCCCCCCFINSCYDVLCVSCVPSVWRSKLCSYLSLTRVHNVQLVTSYYRYIFVYLWHNFHIQRRLTSNRTNALKQQQKQLNGNTHKGGKQFKCSWWRWWWRSNMYTCFHLRKMLTRIIANWRQQKQPIDFMHATWSIAARTHARKNECQFVCVCEYRFERVRVILDLAIHSHNINTYNSAFYFIQKKHLHSFSAGNMCLCLCVLFKRFLNA